ncbi:replicative DNA helicase [Alistipes indistinctus]|uniref:replicative DNA helicase n=1 Tax=Alistipes indistinctus TaxID=626932 RepID=UPI0024BAEB2C|nr:replicative DNA helicase [Alistipes indistinctus]
MNQNTIPHAVELEQSVIGTLIMEPDRLTEVVGVLSPESFCDGRNSFIYQTLIEMFDQNTPVDLYNVGKRCDGSSLFEGRTGTLYASECTCKVGSGVNLLFQAQIIQQRYIARLLMYAGSKISTLAGDDTKDVADVLDESNKLIDKINALSCGSSAGQSLRDSLTESLKLAEQRQAAYLGGSPTGIPTGISDLNRLTGGWRGSQLIILAARPAMGKTALMLHFAKSAALNGTPVCIFSLEMSHVSLSDRLLLSECEVEVNRFRNGDLSGDDWRQLNEASAQLEKLPIHVDDNAVVSMRYIKTRCHILKKQGKCGLIMIDYLQLADTSTKERNRNREQEIAQASRQAKIIAKELDVPVVLLSQLSRECEKRADKQPQLSDLRESGAIEQDADVVGFIFRPAYYGLDRIETLKYGNISTSGLGIINIAKQRDGATGLVAFSHNPSMTKIGDFQENKTPF